MPIAPNSVSYPYLAVAQKHNIDYCEVLRYVDFLEGKLAFCWPPLGVHVRADIKTAFFNECNRRIEAIKKRMDGVKW